MREIIPRAITAPAQQWIRDNPRRCIAYNTKELRRGLLEGRRRRERLLDVRGNLGEPEVGVASPRAGVPRQGSVYKVAVGPTRSLYAGRVANECLMSLN